LADPDQSTVRIVLALEKMSIAEAQRSFTYFHLFGYPSDLVVANRVLPADAGGYFAGLREIQQRYLPVVEQAFGPVPVRTVPMFDREMVGIERLREVGEALFGDGDAAEILYRGRPYEVIRELDGYVLKLELPFASKDEVRLSRAGDELVLHVGTWRRSLVLPRMLIDAPARGAKMEGQTLRIRFDTPAHAAQRAANGGRR
jgi:arsenite-transporting ATPase